MFEHYFSLAGSLVACFVCDTPLPINEQEVMALGAHLPEITLLEERPDKIDFTIEHRERSPFSLHQSMGRVTLQEEWHGRLSPDFVHLFYAVAHRSWLNNGLFPIHAACVGDEERGYLLLVGAAGAGKSSTTLSCVREHGLRMFSGDKSVIQVDELGAMHAIGGTKVVTTRLRDDDRYAEMAEEKMEKGGRRIFRLKESYSATADKVAIKAIVILRLNDGYDHEERLSPLSALHTLYPFFMDSERGDVLLDGGNALYDGGLTREQKLNNAPRLAQAVKKLPALQLIGSMDFVTQRSELLVPKGSELPVLSNECRFLLF